MGSKYTFFKPLNLSKSNGKKNKNKKQTKPSLMLIF